MVKTIQNSKFKIQNDKPEKNIEFFSGFFREFREFREFKEFRENHLDYCVIVLFSGLGDTLEESTMKKRYGVVKFT
ncbi:MAG: hypothetical protein IJ979_05760 [Tidjanibacter sp.]|nr:hypothetical protein [Tidjanibacter sp.]